MRKPTIPRTVFLLGHLGIGLGLAWLLAWRSPRRFDYRLVLLGAILPDLIDKPLGFLLGLETRLWAHTFLFLFVVLGLSFVPPWKPLRFVGFGVATHLLLDQIWAMPFVVWYPAYGWNFPAAPLDIGRWIDTLLHDPYVATGEVVGVLLLVAFSWSHGIRSWRAARAFLAHGALPGKVGR